VQRPERLGELARDDQPVLQRVAEARGRLGTMRHDRPVAVRRTGKIHRDHLQILAARRRKAAHGPQIARVPKHQRGRQLAALQQGLRTVDVGHHRVEQLRPLHHAGFDLGPLGLVDQQRQQIERPRPRLALVRVDVVADVVIADLLRDRGRVVLERGNAVVAEQFEKPPPRLAQRP
jgi:hypothetical protein